MATIRQKEIQTPHFAFPFSFGGISGGAVVNEQDTIDEIVACVQVLIAYPIGSREDEPTFGIPDLVFHQRSEMTMTLLQQALERGEPRAEAIVSEEMDWDEFVQHLQVAVTGGGEG